MLILYYKIRPRINDFIDHKLLELTAFISSTFLTFFFYLVDNEWPPFLEKNLQSKLNDLPI